MIVVFVGGVDLPARVAYALAARGILEADGDGGFAWTTDGRLWLIGSVPEVITLAVDLEGKS